DITKARTALRDLCRAYAAMPSTAPDGEALGKTWVTVRPGIESGLRQALSAQDLAALRSSFETIRKHTTPLIKTDGGSGE
ncbi:MAG: hypothetical protein ACPG4Q_13670, partial [Phycisphaeraceae bacterium]